MWWADCGRHDSGYCIQTFKTQDHPTPNDFRHAEFQNEQCRMSQRDYDLIVIGGGVNGAGVARDAAGRGALVLLLERGDLARGTSSASTKLIHGGLRYLEHYEFSLVREALKERETLWRIAPHLIWPMRFILPHRKGLRPRWLLRLGLFLYDHIGGRKKLPVTRSVDLRTHPAGQPLKPFLTKAFEYSDGWVDDARLVVLNAMDAADRGADIRTRTEVTELKKCPNGWTVSASDQHGTEHQFTAKCVVNAAGPSVLGLLNRAATITKRKMRLVRGSHIVVSRLFDHEYAYFFQLPDGRIFFAIPYEREFTLIGTTDQDHHGSEFEAKASAEEIDYLCEGANQYFQTAIKPDDVVWTYSGVRPLLDDGSGRPEAATRGYALELDHADSGHPLLSILGGKITSYRHVAEEVVDKLRPYLTFENEEHWTASAALPGGDFPMDGAGDLANTYRSGYPFLAPRDIDRIVKAYGINAKIWLGNAKHRSDLGQDFGRGLSAAEVDYLVRREWAMTAEDVLWRRSKLGLLFNADQKAALSKYLNLPKIPNEKVNVE